MFEFLDTQPQVDVPEAEYVRLLGFPRDHTLTGRPRELADWARAWYAEHGRPWIFARRAGKLSTEADLVRLPGAKFRSARLAEQFLAAEASDAILVAVSAGPECEAQARQAWQAEKPDEYFFLEMYGSAVVEHLVTRAAGRICSWADQSGLAVLPHYSPGYSGWPISDQAKLWEIIRGRDGETFLGNLRVLDTGMLSPKKSLLTVFGLTQHADKVQPGSRLVPCENCSLNHCQYRRAPYRYFMPQPEVVGRPEPSNPPATLGASQPLDPSARYSIKTRALKKWAQERLKLEVAGDGSVRARFRYEGTTCSNLGRPLQFDYHVSLQPPAQAYRIAEARCSPADGDLGHTHMCEYLKHPAAFMQELAAEQPLVNRPLNDVLSWERSPNPAGCYCEAGSREHKWGLVFEVIHFALAQNQKPAGQLPAIPEKSPSLYGQTV